ncbi:MAG: sulfite exporter TauE/SafE family protein [Betaproteobacteria bacterium]|nr:sulfite exporter TauE/SafE family protein [Betaproteobacteria bacterium]
MDFAYSLAGLAVGLVVGLTGVGGGSLMTPLLVLLFGITPSTAVGTDLLYAAITKAGGVAVHGWKKTVDWKIVGWMAAGSVPASALTLLLLSGRTGNQSLDVIFSVSLGIMLLLTALALLFRKALQRRAVAYHAARSHPGAHADAIKPFSTLALGAFIGVAVSLSSVGAGAVGVTALILLYPTLPTVRIVGTDIAHAVPLTLVAGLGHALLGHVDGWLLTSLVLGSVPGVMIGSWFATKLPDIYLRHALVVLLLMTGSRLVFK